MLRNASCLLPVLLAPLALLGPDATFAGEPATARHTARTESEIFTMQEVYPSMFGPKDTDAVTLLESDTPEVLWITAIRADVVGPDGETPESQEYFCHSVFSRHTPRPRAFLMSMGLSALNPKLFTLVQGLPEIRFPDGFGMPVLSSDHFESVVMVMNPLEREQPVQVGVDSRIEFARQSELEQPMKPLFLVPLVAKVPVEGPDADHTHHRHDDPGEDTCIDANAHAEVAKPVTDRLHAGSPVVTSDSGLEQTGHWYVPPGRHEYRYRLGTLEELIHFDTRAHYIASHLHPFGESLELIDLTTGKSVFKATARNRPDRIALGEITHYSSQQGIEIDRHHEHEIVAVYNNTLDRDVDSMAVMYLYLHDTAQREAASRDGV